MIIDIKYYCNQQNKISKNIFAVFLIYNICVFILSIIQFFPPSNIMKINTQPRKNRKDVQDQFDRKMQISFRASGKGLVAFLTNFKTHVYRDKQLGLQRSGLLCYFVDQQGVFFKAIVQYSPYFYIGFKQGYERQIRMHIQNKLLNVQKVETVDKIDLQEINHLSGRSKKYMKVSFRTITDLIAARNPLKVLIQRKEKKKNNSNNNMQDFLSLTKKNVMQSVDILDIITGIRQYDIPYHSRVCIDLGLRGGKWFQMDIQNGLISKPPKSRDQLKNRPELKIIAFDIQTSKDPLKFPDAQKDVIMMISMMYEYEACLIINRGFCGQDVIPFDYNPKPQFACSVKVYNQPSEKALLQKFYKIIQFYRPSVITSFNGDKFDIPFIRTRSEKNDLVFQNQSGLYADQQTQFYGRYIAHLDCFYWVQRDAYLPQGSHGLKAVTKAKLYYQPIQIDPEDMVQFAKQNTQRLAEYSVSDAVATYFLYLKHIHDFIFALSTIIPMYPDQVLRKGSGTLCQNLLMAQAYKRNIIFPNKKLQQHLKIIDGKILDTETYTGGKVECLRTGIYRADIQTDFQLQPQAFQDLIQNLDSVLKFAIQQQSKKNIQEVLNYEDVKNSIKKKLEKLRDVKVPHKHQTFPLIYHLDVAAMYPNIILTNRLQPVAIVNDKICSGCLFNDANNNCKRELQWEWKAQIFPLTEGEYQGIKQRLQLQLAQQKRQNNPHSAIGNKQQVFHDAGYQKQLRKRIRMYCQKIYSKVHISRSQIKKDTVCMRQNSFYVDTVRAFRDRRYEFKGAVKKQKAQFEKFQRQNKLTEAKQAKQLMALYESLQLAHKIILNSYYGYVMRKGARWYSMETAAMVTHIGSNIISDCKNFIEARIGKPLELDTDGIWLLLPQGFPQTEIIRFKTGQTLTLSYPCSILNLFIYEKYCNKQYQQLVDAGTLSYQTRSEMSIQFQIDGPYKAMMIPAAKQKQKTKQLDITLHNTQLLKKRYVVFNFKNQISQFKGFQIKRRGQLKIVKIFQSQIFQQFLKGTNLSQCYEACANVGRRWVNIILKKGEGMDQQQLIDHLQESKVLSKDVEQYGTQKGVAVTSAKRLCQFLGSGTIRGKGICCYYVISEKPIGRPITQRAIPTSIFQAQQSIQRQYLFKWTGQQFTQKIDIKKILDWNYYFQRLSSTIQKMICIPAVLQNLNNPLPQVPLPEWLGKKKFDQKMHKQQRISDFTIKNQTQRNQYNLTLSKALAGSQEDEKNHRSNKNYHKTQSSKKGQIKLQQFKQIIPQINQKNPYSLNNQFSKWLETQQKIWIQSSLQNQENVSISNLNNWNILQIVSQKTPGSYLIWYCASQSHFNSNQPPRIQSCTVMLKRKYYIKQYQRNTQSNFYFSDGNKKQAPRNEGFAYQHIDQQLNFIKQKQYHDSFIGTKMFQTKIPLDINFIINKGNMCRIKDQRTKNFQQQNFIQIFGQDYLERIQDNFMTVLLIFQTSVLGKNLWGVFNPKLKQYQFYFVEKNIRKQKYQKQAREYLGIPDAKTHTENYQTNQQACQAINNYILQFLEDHKSPFLVVVQSQLPTNTLPSLGLKSLFSQIPVLTLPKPILNKTKISALDWQIKLLKLAIDQSLNMETHLFKLLKYSRYAHIPICNLSQQQNLLDFISNIMYSRILRASDNILWWGDYNGEILMTYQSQNYTGRILNPGLYSSFTIEIDMANLALNTIAITDELGTVDRQTALIGEDNGPKKVGIKQGALDNVVSAQIAYEYLKKMVKCWIKDLEGGSEEGDQLLQNLHKWLITRTNALYDPFLHGMLTKSMKKVFYYLMLKMKDLGINIVFGNFQKIVVCTQKHTMNEAINSIQYVLKKCVQDQKKLYKYMIFSPIKIWSVLLYKDPYNYAGYYCLKQQKQDQDGKMIIEEQTQQYDSKWKLTKCLSPIISRFLAGSIFIYLGGLKKVKQQVLLEGASNVAQLLKTMPNKIIENMLKFVNGEFAEKMQEQIYYLMNQWENHQMTKNYEVVQEQQKSQQQEQVDQQQQQDDFIVDDQDQFNEKGKKKKNNNQNIKDKRDWAQTHQIQKLVQNLFQLINTDDEIGQNLSKLRRKCLQIIQFQPLIKHKTVEPVYPIFQIPCDQCFKINQAPGICICQNPLKNSSIQIEQQIWKMMKQVGRDLYCETCANIKQQYLKIGCSCGGKWKFKEFPLKWIPYVEREGQQWGYVNKVFEFMSMG